MVEYAMLLGLMVAAGFKLLPPLAEVIVNLYGTVIYELHHLL